MATRSESSSSTSSTSSRNSRLVPPMSSQPAASAASRRAAASASAAASAAASAPASLADRATSPAVPLRKAAASAAAAVPARASPWAGSGAESHLRLHPWASQPHIVVAEQKDAAAIRRLARRVADYLDSTSFAARYVSTLGPEIQLIARVLYYLPTVCVPRSMGISETHAALTLGEEYCDLRAVFVSLSDDSRRMLRGHGGVGLRAKGTHLQNLAVPAPVVLPQPLTQTRAVLSVAVRTVGEYALERGAVGWDSLMRVAQFRSPRLVATINMVRSWRQSIEKGMATVEARLASAVRAISGQPRVPSAAAPTRSLVFQWFERAIAHISTVQRLHLCLFFLSGAYYSLSKRLFRVRHMHLYASGPPGETPGYRMLGLITATEVGLALFLWFWRHTSRLLPSSAAPADGQNPNEVTQTVPSLLESEDEESSLWQCGICMCDCTNASACPCGHLFCWECIVQWAGNKLVCPLCRQPFELRQLIRIHG